MYEVTEGTATASRSVFHWILTDIPFLYVCLCFSRYWTRILFLCLRHVLPFLPGCRSHCYDNEIKIGFFLAPLSAGGSTAIHLLAKLAPVAIGSFCSSSELVLNDTVACGAPIPCFGRAVPRRGIAQASEQGTSAADCELCFPLSCPLYLSNKLMWSLWGLQRPFLSFTSLHSHRNMHKHMYTHTCTGISLKLSF